MIRIYSLSASRSAVFNFWHVGCSLFRARGEREPETAMNMKVMVVDGSGERALEMCRAVQEEGHEVVVCIRPGDDLLAQVHRYQPDMIIMELDTPARDILEDMQAMSRELPRPVVMFTNDGDATTIQAAVAAGVSAYVVDGLRAERIKPLMDVAVARFNAFHQLKSERDEARQGLAERKLIDKAKGILMRQRGLDEEGAYRLLRKSAMDRNQRIAEVARDLIEMAELLG